MLKSTIVALALVAISPAFASATAEIYSCSFTEPFISFDYDSSTGRMVSSDPANYEEKEDGSIQFTPVITDNVSMRVTAAGKFELVDIKGVTLFELELTGKGSDGMSDILYPFDVKSKIDAMPMDYLGGCSSTSLPATNEYEEAK